MILIVGLGNPGEKYENTRHNLGFMAIDDLAQIYNGKWKTEKKFDCQLAIIDTKILGQEGKLILVKPLTFMNASGFAVSKLMSFYKIEPKNLWVIHDDLDIAPGKFKIKSKGGSAGHRGVSSIVEQLGTTEFVRFRLGIGRPFQPGEERLEKYVLEGLSSKDMSDAKKGIKKVIQAITFALEEGVSAAQNRYNE